MSIISPALVAAPGGGYQAFMRLTWRRGQWSHGSYVWSQDLGAELSPLSASPLTAVPLPAAMDVYAGGAEDPRAIVRPSDGAVLIVFNAQFAKEGARSMYLMDTSPRGHTHRLRVPGSILGEGIQKNWAPFFHEGELHFVYNYNPLVVLKCGDEGECLCVHSDAPGGCLDLQDLAKGSAMRMGSPLVELGDSGVFATALHSIITTPKTGSYKHGYRGHLALLTSRPWGWLAVSDELETPPHVRACGNLLSKWLSQGIDFPTSLLLVGEGGESLLLGAHYHDSEASVQQLMLAEPLIDYLAALPCDAAAPEGAFIRGSNLAPLTTSRGAAVPRCGSWATLPAASLERVLGILSHRYRHLSSLTTPSCAAGTFVNASFVCQDCPANSFSAANSLSGNSTFGNSTFGNSTTASSCTACPANTFSAPGAAACTPCPTGTTSFSGFDCTGAGEYCPPGYYTPPSGGECQRCTSGALTCSASSGATACLAGFYLSDGAGQPSTCELCPAGSTCAGGVASAVGGCGRQQTGLSSCPMPVTGDPSSIVNDCNPFAQQCSLLGASNFAVWAGHVDSTNGVFSGSLVTNYCPHDYRAYYQSRAAIPYLGDQNNAALLNGPMQHAECGLLNFPATDPATPSRVPVTGSLGYTLHGEKIYGGMDNGFSSLVNGNVPAQPLCRNNNNGGCPVNSDVTSCQNFAEATCGTTDFVAVTTGTAYMLNDCGGHASYHYHLGLNCSVSSTVASNAAPTGISWLDASVGTGHSTLAGIMLDGRGLYGPYESSGMLPTDLDACNGHTHAVPATTLVTNTGTFEFPASASTYHYHVTAFSPYTLGCFGGPSGVPTMSAALQLYQNVDPSGKYGTCAVAGTCSAASNPSWVEAGCINGNLWTACTSLGVIKQTLSCPIYQVRFHCF